MAKLLWKHLHCDANICERHGCFTNWKASLLSWTIFTLLWLCFDRLLPLHFAKFRLAKMISDLKIYFRIFLGTKTEFQSIDKTIFQHSISWLIRDDCTQVSTVHQIPRCQHSTLFVTSAMLSVNDQNVFLATFPSSHRWKARFGD